MRNCILVNNSTPGATSGNTVAYWRTASGFTTYSATSNNNDLYAGTPGIRNLVYYDPTNTTIQTLALYQALVTPRDNASITENPPPSSIIPTRFLPMS